MTLKPAKADAIEVECVLGDTHRPALFHAAAVPVLCSALFVVGLGGATRARGTETPAAA